jgi:hypothetical protein
MLSPAQTPPRAGGNHRDRRRRRSTRRSSDGDTTLADNLLCGKSIGFNVTRKSALPSWAHAQKQLSPGSGEISAIRSTTTVVRKKGFQSVFVVQTSQNRLGDNSVIARNPMS